MPVAIVVGFAAQRTVSGVPGLALTLALVWGVMVLVWWIRGGRGWRIDEELHVAASPEATFAILDDPARAARLDPRVVAVEVDGPLGPGQRVRARLDVGRREVVDESVIVDRVPPTLLVADVRAVTVGGRPVQIGTQRQTLAFSPAPGGGTRVALRVRGRPVGFASRMRIGLVHPGEARNARAALRRLADQVSVPERSL